MKRISLADSAAGDGELDGEIVATCEEFYSTALLRVPTHPMARYQTREYTQMVLLGVVLIASVLPIASAIRTARKPADWAQMSDKEWEEVAAQWDEEDDLEERKEEGQFEYERMMQQKKRGVPVGVSDVALCVLE